MFNQNLKEFDIIDSFNRQRLNTEILQLMIYSFLEKHRVVQDQYKLYKLIVLRRCRIKNLLI